MRVSVHLSLSFLQHFCFDTKLTPRFILDPTAESTHAYFGKKRLKAKSLADFQLGFMGHSRSYRWRLDWYYASTARFHIQVF